MAKMAQEYGITKCVVRDECEADEVSEYFNDILILSPRIYSDNQKFIYTINDYSDLENIKYKDLNIALKVDSGMHRNGVIVEELEDALSCIEKSSLTLHSVFTHFRSADSLSSEWFWQNKNYHDIKKIVEEKFSKNVLFHAQNSAALFRTQTIEDWVRVGIAAYGCLEMDKTLLNEPLNFKPVLSLWGEKVSQKTLYHDNRVGYNGVGVVESDNTIVSNYDVGYADGFMRSASPHYTTPNGEKIVGRVSMDNSSFVSDKEELLIFDNASIASEAMNTISYELLVRLNERLERRVCN